MTAATGWSALLPMNAVSGGTKVVKSRKKRLSHVNDASTSRTRRSSRRCASQNTHSTTKLIT